MKGMATLPQGKQELLVVKDKVGRPPDKLGVSKSLEFDIFSLSALTLLVGRQEWHPACKQEAQLMLTTGSTRLAVSRGQQTWYHSTCYI